MTPDQLDQLSRNTAKEFFINITFKALPTIILGLGIVWGIKNCGAGVVWYE